MLPYWNFTFADEFLYCVCKLRSGLLNERGWKFASFAPAFDIVYPARFRSQSSGRNPTRCSPLMALRQPASERGIRLHQLPIVCIVLTRKKACLSFAILAGRNRECTPLKPAGRRPVFVRDRPLGSCNGDPSVSRAAKCPEYEMRATAAETEDGVQPCCDAAWRLRIGCRKLSLSAENARSRETFQLYVLLQKLRESPVRIWHSSVRLRSSNKFSLVYVFVFIENLITRSRLNPNFSLNFYQILIFYFIIKSMKRRGVCVLYSYL